MSATSAVVSDSGRVYGGRPATVSASARGSDGCPPTLDGCADSPGSLPLAQAVRSGNVTAVQEALAAGANPTDEDGSGFPALHVAAAAGDAVIVALLLDAHAPVSVRSQGGLGSTALHCAVASGAVNVVERLFQCRADPNIADGTGATPLHIAASIGRIDLVKRLLAAGADPAAEWDGVTAETLAWAARHHDTVALLRQVRPEPVRAGRQADPHTIV